MRQGTALSTLPSQLQLKNLAQFIALTGRIRSRSRWEALTDCFLKGYMEARETLPVQDNLMKHSILKRIDMDRRVENNLQELTEP